MVAPDDRGCGRSGDGRTPPDRRGGRPAGKFAPVWKVPARSLAGAVIGGLLLGYGARLAFGCNIGAYFSGILSGSLHAWLWLPAAFAGSALGVRLRPLFGLAVEKTPSASSC